jgi:histidine triad (HIT) family protein
MQCIILFYFYEIIIMNCLFCNIAQGNIPASRVFEDEDIISFHDLNPQAPKHMLIIPKQHIATLNDANEGNQLLLGKMVLAAKQIAKTEGINEAGYRLIFNTNPDGGQTVYHIHLHLLGGRRMTWPPG